MSFSLCVHIYKASQPRGRASHDACTDNVWNIDGYIHTCTYKHPMPQLCMRYYSVLAHVHVHVHVCSVIETRQSKSTMTKDNSFSFSELPQAGLKPTTFYVLGRPSTNWQLSWAGWIFKKKLFKGKGISSLINRVTQFSTVEWARVIKPPRHPSSYWVLSTEWLHVCSVIETRQSKATIRLRTTVHVWHVYIMRPHFLVFYEQVYSMQRITLQTISACNHVATSNQPEASSM